VYTQYGAIFTGQQRVETKYSYSFVARIATLDLP